MYFRKGLLGQKFYFKCSCTHTHSRHRRHSTVGELPLAPRCIGSPPRRPIKQAVEASALFLNTWDVASEHMQRSDISVDGLDSLCTAEFISACSLAGCPDFQMSQNPRQIDKILQFCTDSISYGGKKGYFQGKHGCLVTLLRMASVRKAASGAGKVNPCKMPASLSSI